MRYLTFGTAIKLAVLFWLTLPAAADDFLACEKQSGDVAIKACNRAIASGKLTKGQLAWAHHNRAVEYEIKEEYDSAIADYSATLSIDRRHRGALVGRGNCYSEKKEYDRALRDYNESISQTPTVNAYFNRGLNYERMKDYALAKADYETAIRLPTKDNADVRSQARAPKQMQGLPKN